MIFGRDREKISPRYAGRPLGFIGHRPMPHPSFWLKELIRIFKSLRGKRMPVTCVMPVGYLGSTFLISRHIVPNIPKPAFLMSRHIVPNIPTPVPDVPTPGQALWISVPDVPTVALFGLRSVPNVPTLPPGKAAIAFKWPVFEDFLRFREVLCRSCAMIRDIRNALP